MKFSKMHGLGNDYIYVNTIEERIEEPERIAKLVSDRHFGVGADGLILIGASQNADFSMDIYNADGSRGEMCGNGIRCVAKYVYERGLTRKARLSIETRSGIRIIRMIVQNNKVEQVEVNMGKPWYSPQKTPLIIGEDTYTPTLISMGNPHAVLYVEDPAVFPVAAVGAKIECHEQFPNRVNVEFCKVVNREQIEMRVWERGSGETLACGTGACAAAVAGVLNDLTEEAVTIKLLGGDLFVKWERKSNRVLMTGPAAFVFDGEIKFDQ